MIPAERIRRFKNSQKESWLSEERHKCICGEEFRCKSNLKTHQSTCLEIKYSN